MWGIFLAILVVIAAIILFSNSNTLSDSESIFAHQIITKTEVKLSPDGGGNESDRPLTPDCSNNRFYQDVLRQLQENNCDMPDIVLNDSTICKFIGEDLKAAYCCKPNEIHFCKDPYDDPDNFCTFIAHELVHSLDSCLDQNFCTEDFFVDDYNCGKVGDCEKLFCTEVRAYALSGMCCIDGELNIDCVDFHARGSALSCDDELSERDYHRILNRCLPQVDCSAPSDKSGI